METEIKKPEVERPKIMRYERVLRQCPYCGHRYMIRDILISNIRDARFQCEYCNRKI